MSRGSNGESKGGCDGAVMSRQGLSVSERTNPNMTVKEETHASAPGASAARFGSPVVVMIAARVRERRSWQRQPVGIE